MTTACARRAVATRGRLAVAGVLYAAMLGACAPDAPKDTTAGATGNAPAGARRVTAGMPAPEYAIETLRGDSLVLGAGDQVVLLNVWATWCASCKEEFAFMDELLARYGARGLRVVAVSVDAGSTAPVERVARQYGVTFEVAHDPEGRVEQQFPAIGVPASYLIGRDGSVIWARTGVLPPAVDSVIAEAVGAAVGGPLEGAPQGRRQAP